MKFKAMILASLLMLSTGTAYASDTTTSKSSGREETAKTVPTEIKAAFPGAKSFGKTHKNLTKEQISFLEKEVGTKIPDTDFHTYVAYGTKNGKKAQLGAGTIIQPKGMKYIIIYENNITVKKIIPVKADSDLKADSFLKQFNGKTHDFKVAKDIKLPVSKKADGKVVADAIKMDILTLQTLYGKPDKH